MRAIRRTAPGSWEFGEVPTPTPGAGESLVQMVHAAINPFDLQVLRGEIGGSPTDSMTLGAEGVGLVDGRLVQVSGRGLGASRDGTFAGWVAAPDAALRPVPDGMDPRVAATVGVAGKTAWRVVHQLAKVTAHDTVLVLGAGGGVGTFAAQLARAAGAHVLAQTGDAQKAPSLEQLGLEPLVASTPESLRDLLAAREASVVLDPLGGDYWSAALMHLAPGARIVTYGVLHGVTTSLNLQSLYGRGIRVIGTSGGTTPAHESDEAMAGALASVKESAVKVSVRSIGFDQAELAFELLRTRAVTGKLVLDFSRS